MIMNLIEMRKYLETGFGAKHMATGRVFILLESFGIPAKHIGGLDKQNLVIQVVFVWSFHTGTTSV